MKKDKLMIKKPVTFYVDKEVFKKFKSQCTNVLQDDMKSVILTLAQLYNSNVNPKLTEYLKRIIKTKLDYTISYKRDNLHRFRARCSESELYVLKQLSEKLEVSISKLVTGIMFTVVAFNLDLPTYEDNKRKVQQDLPNLSYSIKLELLIVDELYHNLVSYVNTKYYDEIYKGNPSISEVRNRIKKKMQQIATEAIEELVEKEIENIEIANNPFNF